MDTETAGHTEKILADLLALALADNEPEAIAAIGAIRRRAERDAVTGGVVKSLVQRLLHTPGTTLVVTSMQDEVSELRWVVGDQRRELDQTRHAMHRCEIALSETRQTNGALADRIGLLSRMLRRSRVLGFLAGLCCGAGGFAAYQFAGLIHLGAHTRPATGLPGPTQAAIVDRLHSCFLSSVNSLAGGAGFDMHLLVDTDAAGRITRVTLAPGQATALDDPQLRQYSDLMLRTLGPGCGVLPLPASWLGRPGRLDLMLPP